MFLQDLTVLDMDKVFIDRLIYLNTNFLNIYLVKAVTIDGVYLLQIIEG
jgi:hypothetical protein